MLNYAQNKTVARLCFCRRSGEGRNPERTRKTNGRLANRPYGRSGGVIDEGQNPNPWIPAFAGMTILTPRSLPRPRLPAFAAARKEAKKVPFGLKRARLTIKRASFSCFFRRFENVSIRANSKRIQGVFKRIHALLRTHNRLIHNEKRRIGLNLSE